jgi:hypothetical protein
MMAASSGGLPERSVAAVTHYENTHLPSLIALMMEAVRTSEKSVNFNVTTRSNIP